MVMSGVSSPLTSPSMVTLPSTTSSPWASASVITPSSTPAVLPPVSASSKVMVSAVVGSLVGERQRLAQRQIVGAAEIGERGVGIVGIELVVERGDLETCGELRLEGAEVEGAPAADEVHVAVEAAGVGGDGVGLIAVAVEVEADRRLVERVAVARIDRRIRDASGLSAMVSTAPPLSASTPAENAGLPCRRRRGRSAPPRRTRFPVRPGRPRL